MADNIKISELVELTSGSLSDATIFPVVDGGSTKKASLSSLQSYLTDDLATDAELSTQISNVNSTINALDTDDIAEGSNQYFTNARVDDRISSLGAITSSAGVDLTATQNYISGIKSRLNAETVISSSAQISSSAAAAGFGAGGGGGTADYTQLTNVPSGIVSSSIQVTYTGLSGIPDGIVSSSTQISASAAASGFGAGGEGGGGNDYISDVSLSNSTLTFTGVGSAFNSTINLANGESDGGNLLTTADAGNFLGTATYETDSGSFASRLDAAGGGGGGSTPAGTVSSSAQTIENLGGTGILSGSLDVSQLDLSNTTTDDITEGTINKYYANSLVLPYLNTLQVLSGSGAGGAGDYNSLSNIPANIVSSSNQIELLGFVTNGVFGSGTASLQQQINDITSSQESVTLSDVNVFTAKQKFEQDIEVTGSILLSGAGKHFSGSGAQLFNIPSTAIVGASTDNSIVDGDNNVTVDNVSGVTVTLTSGQLFITGGDVYVTGGAFSGSGAGLTDIPGTAILGGVDGQKIASSSFSASIEDGTGNFIVGPYAIFENDVYSSGSVTAQSISVGTSGTPTVYSSTNLNLSASNAVVVTDSPMRLNPFAAADTASFTLAEGDMVFSSDDNDFFGYRIVNQTGSWYSLTAGTVTSVEWDTIVGAPGGLVSSSEQIVGVGNELISSSAQFLPSASVGTIYYHDTLDEMSGSNDFTYTAGTKTLSVNKVVANELVYNTSLTGAGNDTGSYGRVETDALNINSAIEFPQSDGTPNQILKTDGNGNLGFAAFADVLGNDNISSNGTITMGTGSINTNLSVGGTLNLGSPVHSTFNNLTTTIDAANVSILSSGSMTLSSSMDVTIQDVLVLPERATNPSNPQDGSIIVSSSAGQLRPYFWDGSAWKGISFTS